MLTTGNTKAPCTPAYPDHAWAVDVFDPRALSLHTKHPFAYREHAEDWALAERRASVALGRSVKTRVYQRRTHADH